MLVSKTSVGVKIKRGQFSSEPRFYYSVNFCCHESAIALNPSVLDTYGNWDNNLPSK